jgi:hypothetical protein
MSVTRENNEEACQLSRADAAIRTLAFFGYTYDGSTYWKPPVGEDPLAAAAGLGETCEP